MNDNNLNRHDLNQRRIIKESIDTGETRQDNKPEKRLFYVIILLILIFFVLVIYSGVRVVAN